MLKTNVGYSILNDSFENGIEVANKTINGLSNPKVALLYSSSVCDHEKLIQGFKSIRNIPIIGCTSSDAIIVQDGIINSETGFSGAIAFDDETLKVGIAGMQKDNDARLTGRQVAIEAIRNANTDIRPSYFYMISSPTEEEEYLKGIQDIIGRVPMFGGSSASNNMDNTYKIYCNDKIFSEGCAVAFFYTDRDFETEFTGAYHETNRKGVVTKVENKRKLVEIDGEMALKKYSEYRGINIDNLKDNALCNITITNPFGVKDSMDNITVINHPITGNSDYSINFSNNLVEGTCINMLDSTIDEFVKSTSDAVNIINTKLNNNVSGYLLIHNAFRKDGIKDRMLEVYNELKNSCGNIPFIMIFSSSEFGYHEHSANACGSLMLSFTGFEK